MALELYKPDDATRIRGLMAVLMAGMMAYAVYSLHEFLAAGFWADDLTSGTFGADFPVSPRVVLCLALGVALSVGIYIVSNHPRVVDFLIDTEKEMQNVSWPPQHEVISSSLIVCLTVVIMAVYLGLVDYVLILAKDKVPWDTLWDKIFGAGA